MDDPDERARETEAQMTDEERFSLLVSMMGTNDVVRERDERIPEGVPMRKAFAEGQLPPERLSEMVRRILRSMYAIGIDAWQAGSPAAQDDQAAHHAIALDGARQGLVLLENDGILPLAGGTTARIAVIGGYAELGVPVGTGSSAVMPPGGYAAVVHVGGPGIMGSMRNLYLLPSSPMAELGKLLPEAQVEYDPGMTPAEAALLAQRSDVAIVFGIRVEGEGYDLPDLSLPWGQDAVIDAVASANPNTIVVLETGNPVAMPWRDKVRAIVQAWYPGQAGGQAIAEVLSGAVHPSGRLPMRFPADLDQTPRPELPGLGTPWGTPTTVAYDEGAEVGYRWFAQEGRAPLYAFGPRPGLHELRLRRARGRRRRHRHRALHRHATRASATAPRCPSSTSPPPPATIACGCWASSAWSWRRESHAP
jgi:beta-glucosidase